MSLQDAETKIALCLIQKIDLLGVAWPVWVCKNTGVPYGTPECANMTIFGKCEPRDDVVIGSKQKPRSKYRKTSREQKTLDGRTLWKARWGIKEDEATKV